MSLIIKYVLHTTDKVNTYQILEETAHFHQQQYPLSKNSKNTPASDICCHQNSLAFTATGAIKFSKMYANVETDDTFRIISRVFFPNFFLFLFYQNLTAENSTLSQISMDSPFHFKFFLGIKLAIEIPDKVNGTLFLRRTELKRESMNRIKILESKQDYLIY